MWNIRHWEECVCEYTGSIEMSTDGIKRLDVILRTWNVSISFGAQVKAIASWSVIAIMINCMIACKECWRLYISAVSALTMLILPVAYEESTANTYLALKSLQLDPNHSPEERPCFRCPSRVNLCNAHTIRKSLRQLRHMPMSMYKRREGLPAHHHLWESMNGVRELINSRTRRENSWVQVFQHQRTAHVQHIGVCSGRDGLEGWPPCGRIRSGWGQPRAACRARSASVNIFTSIDGGVWWASGYSSSSSVLCFSTPSRQTARRWVLLLNSRSTHGQRAPRRPVISAF